MKTIHDLTKRVEDAHVRHLKEVKSLEEQTRNVSISASPQPANVTSINDTAVSFESLVAGKNTSEKSDELFSSQPTSQQTWTSPMSQPAIVPTKTTSTNWNSAPSNNWNSQPKASTTTTSWNSSQAATTTTTTTNNINWNSQKSITPQQQPQPKNNWSVPLSPSMNSQKPPNNTNWNSQQPTNGWSSSIQQQQQQQIPSLSTPPSFQTNSMNQQQNISSNFNALRSIPVSSQPSTMMPLSSGMGLLQPISSNSQSKNNTPQPTKIVNLHAFDPLG